MMTFRSFSDFLSNLLVLLLRILNSGISDSGLLAHLSEATAGSLNGVGHSTAYEELATYRLAVEYLFLKNEGITDHTPLVVEPFNANTTSRTITRPLGPYVALLQMNGSRIFSGARPPSCAMRFGSGILKGHFEGPEEEVAAHPAAAFEFIVG
jgi:hypothetical protein